MVINFGTDGWRAIIADQFTFENVAICTNATLDYLKQNGLNNKGCLLYTSPSPRDGLLCRMPSSA